MSNEPHELPWSGERYVPQVAGNIRIEHLHRYLAARHWCHGRRVLDIASGEGYGAELLAQVAAHVYGVDVAAEAIDHARDRYRRPNLEFSVGDCTAIPLPDASVDVVVSFETIEHHDRHDEMMREVRRVLAPGGTLVISSPDRHEYSDLPRYTNPFHVRELYRDEFEGLLHSHFRHVAVAGQRMKAGSVIWPMDGQGERSFEGFAASARLEEVEPLGAPLYLLAVASDEPVTPIPTGLLDGGHFVWFDDHVAAFTEAEKQLHAHIGTVETARARSDARADAAEQARQVAELARDEAELARTAAEQGRDDAERGRERADGEAGELRDLAATLREELQRSIAAHGEERRRLEQRIRIMERSRSWRLTAPLRMTRSALTAGAGAPASQSVRQAARALYAALPLSTSARLRIRTALFRTMPFLFRRSAAYRAWDAYQRTQARTEARMDARMDARAAAVARAPEMLPEWFYADPSEDYVAVAASTHVDTRIKAIAFYLPQFHPIPENDQWWGRGFTEWTNVTRGKPQFVGHYQPHLPGELGFYDLRVPDIQRRQIELARTYGIHGFCLHHYWFGGKSLLRRPLEQLLANEDMAFPFCLCWANENWTRRWDGQEADVLIEQQHSADDDLAFIRDIEPALRDPRYIRIGGRPLLVVYRPALLPDARATAARWRAYCRDAGLGDPYLVSTQAFERADPAVFGFDAALEFAPNNLGAPLITDQVTLVNPEFAGAVYDYRYLVEYSRTCTPEPYTLFRSVTPMWDNEARRPGRGAVFAHSSPALYREALEHICRYADRHQAPDARFVFINAWNEWAEGAHLEPDRRHGYAYLQATADALRRFPTVRHPPVVCVSHDAHHHGAQLLTLNLARTFGAALGREVELLLCGDGVLTPEFERAARVHDFRAGAVSRETRQRLLQDLYDGGARLAFCNTCAVGETVALLKGAGFTVVSMVHELPDLIRRHQLEASARLVATHADRVVFAAELVRDQFCQLTGMAPEKAVVRPQGLYMVNRFKGRIDEARDALRARLGLSRDTRIVLGAGFGDYRKGIDLFVGVGLRLVEHSADVRLVWIGHHDAAAFAEANARIEESGHASHFLFPGIAEEPDRFFAGSDLFLLTSREDPFPAVVVEALDARLPVIGFEGGGGFVELLRRGCGVLVPFADVDAMAAAARRLLDDPVEVQRIAAVGQRIVDQEFEFTSYARFLIELASPPRPTISVIIPNYNYEGYLPRRLQSILEQTVRPDEILFLDDASSDDSVAVASRVLARGGIPYRVIRNETTAGCYPQWLRGLREAAGDLVWIAEADDDCSPTLLETLVPAFTRESVVLAYCQSQQIDGAGREIAPDYLAWTADLDPDKWRHAYVRRGIDEIRDSLIVKNTIPNVSAVVMRRPDLSPIAQELATLRNAGDWMVYLHLLEHGDVAYVPQALNRHRRHGGSVTIGKGGLNLMREMLTVQRRSLDRHPLTAAVEAKREACLQTIYEYLGLNAGGTASYREHEALKQVLPAATR